MCWCKLNRADIVFLTITVILFLIGFLCLVIPLVESGTGAYYSGGGYYYAGYIVMAIGIPLSWSLAVLVGAIIWPSVRFCATSRHSIYEQSKKEYGKYLAEQQQELMSKPVAPEVPVVVVAPPPPAIDQVQHSSSQHILLDESQH